MLFYHEKRHETEHPVSCPFFITYHSLLGIEKAGDWKRKEKSPAGKDLTLCSDITTTVSDAPYPKG